jgi:hypothetical protein
MDRIPEAIRVTAGLARSLKLLPDRVLEQLFSKTIENMSRRDIENLAEAARQLSLVLSAEAGKRI